jgi:transketolase
MCRTAANGHIGAASAAVELMTVLYFGGVLRFDPSDPHAPQRDRVLVRGHLGPLRYSIFAMLGWLQEDELSSYRQLGSRLPGHEDHETTPGVDITPSGSLGMLLSYGVGAAVSARNRAENFTTYVFLGDGEEQEGNVSEAARHAGHLKLSNLVVILDQNGKQLSDPVSVCDSADIAALWRGYGWDVVYLADGNDIAAVREILTAERSAGRPTLIIARTVKGLGLRGAEAHFSGFHTTGVCPPEVLNEAIAELQAATSLPLLSTLVSRDRTRVREERGGVRTFSPLVLTIAPGEGSLNNPMCQADYFRLLREPVERAGLCRDQFYFLTADITRRDDVDVLGIDTYMHYMNVGVREQHMIAMAHGLSITHPDVRIIINSFDAFTFRALDQIAAAVQGGSSMIIIADVAGVTNARNGKTHQSASQPGAISMCEGVTFLEPWDLVDVFNCLNWAIGESRGIVYLRTHKATVNVAAVSADRNIGYYEINPTPSPPNAVIVATGFMVTHALGARERLAGLGINARVLNVVNPKGLDDGRFIKLIPPGVPIVTVYNGVPEVLRTAVCTAVLNSGRNCMPKLRALGFYLGATGRLEDVVSHLGLDAVHIARTVEEMLT